MKGNKNRLKNIILIYGYFVVIENRDHLLSVKLCLNCDGKIIRNAEKLLFEA